MKLSEQLAEFYEHSSKVSDLVRTINYSLIALVWILAHETTYEVIKYQWVILFIILSLFFDFLHYIWLSVTTCIAYDKNEKENSNRKKGKDPEVTYPLYIKKWSWGFFGFKVLWMIIAVVILLYQVFNIIVEVPETDNNGFYLLDLFSRNFY